MNPNKLGEWSSAIVATVAVLSMGVVAVLGVIWLWRVVLGGPC